MEIETNPVYAPAIVIYEGEAFLLADIFDIFQVGDHLHIETLLGSSTSSFQNIRRIFFPCTPHSNTLLTHPQTN